jgi:hypothetical protein
LFKGPDHEASLALSGLAGFEKWGCFAFAPATASRIKPPDDLTGDARTVFVDLVLSTRAASLSVLEKTALAVSRTTAMSPLKEGHPVG